MEFPPELQKLFNREFSKIQYENCEPIRKFPNGFKWRYLRSKILHRREKLFCWSITRNENNKFISWVYVWKITGKRKQKQRIAEFTKIREHKYKKKAKARALKLYAKEKLIKT